MYSLEEVVKVYTFEDQLLIFKAYWDYLTGELVDESFSTFFYRDITSVTTYRSYANFKKEKKEITAADRAKAYKKHFLKILPLMLLIAGFLAAIGAGVGILISDGLAPSFWIFGLIGFAGGIFLGKYLLSQLYAKLQGHIKRVRKADSLVIATPSNKTAIHILSDEWIEAQDGVFESRTDAEKLFHAIRKMIEEKKEMAK